ncbi:MAG: NAD(P)/FAD-dependent oxidoreductase [Flavobacteriales bacterium]|nr:NAD(P)/FAD-dependent oxidoreductase [Flavobacteriales bacterium]
MDITETEYDVVIVGSGLGGLACAYILAKAGKKVICLEKNHQIGGNLQVFSREKTVFDTGVHYLGGLDKGQNLYKLFRYFGIYDDLKLIRMDEEGFDRLHFHDEEKTYKYGMGYEKFIENLVADFPEERAAIEKYCELIQLFCSKFPLYNLIDKDVDYMGDEFLVTNAKETIDGLTDNQRLRDILAATNMLYAGTPKTPFYVHALVINSYIQSSYRCIDGGSQIAILMQRRIRKFGGEVVRRAKVVSANYEGDDPRKVSSVNLEDGRVIKGKAYISNMHPQQTIEIFGEEKFRKAYVNRIMSLKNTSSSFTLHLVFKPETFKYLNYNLYQYNDDSNAMWDFQDYDKAGWPQGYMLSTPASTRGGEWADGASIMCYMRPEEVEEWTDSFNTVTTPGERPQGYEDFKKVCAEKILDVVSKQFPNIRDITTSYYCSTPLTFRDYIGTSDGNLYGVEKNSDDPLKTFINPKTRIPNLILTGANINLHGILGVAISSLVSSFEFVDRKELLKEINELD